MNRLCVSGITRSAQRVLGRTSTVAKRGFVLAPSAALTSELPLIRKWAPQTAVVRAFGSSSALSANSELVEALSSELASEESEFEVDPDLTEISEQIKKSFTIEDATGMGVVKLSSKFSGGKGGDEEVTITFDCQDEAEMDGMDLEALSSLAESMEDDDEDDDNEDTVLDFGINMKVNIAKKDGSKLVVDCICAKELQIESVQYVPAALSEKKDEELYGGPVFDQLDESVQDAFYEYLADRKIDNDLSFFVLAYSRDKEQKEYMNWLTQVMDFVH
jgi:complement component 1 Q subcomponent-binding protein, mitochondrial